MHALSCGFHIRSGLVPRASRPPPKHAKTCEHHRKTLRLRDRSRCGIDRVIVAACAGDDEITGQGAQPECGGIATVRKSAKLFYAVEVRDISLPKMAKAALMVSTSPTRASTGNPSRLRMGEK